MHRVLVVLLTLIFSSSLDAQRFDMDSYFEVDGLPSPVVSGITQANDGVIWIACRSGLVTYDGNQWKAIPHPSNLDSEFVTHLGNTDGALWCVANDRVVILREGEWRTLPRLDPAKTKRVRVAACILDRGELTFALGTRSGELFVWRDKAWQKPVQLGSIFAVSGSQGEFWVATSGGLYRADRKGLHSVPLELHSRSVQGVACDGDAVWLAGSTWIAQLRDGVTTVLIDDVITIDGLSLASILLEPDGRGGLFLAPPDGVFHFKQGDGLTEVSTASGEGLSNRTDLFLDRENLLWMTSNRGVIKLVSRRMAIYDRDQGLFEDEVSAVLHRSNGETVLGHNGGLTFVSDSLRTVAIGRRPKFARVMDLAEDSTGTLWIAAEFVGLMRISPTDALDCVAETESRGIHSVCVREGDEVWLGSQTGLYKYEDGKVVPVPLIGAGLCPVRRLTETTDGTLWVATSQHGVIALKDSVPVKYSHVDELVRSAYTTLEVDGEIWVGTRAGLYRIDFSTKSLVASSIPRFSRPVFALARDHAGDIWIGSDNGVLRWDGDQLDHFDARRGLTGTEVNRAALEVDSSGRVWIGTDRGVAVYRREWDVDSKVGPAISFDHVIVDGVEHSPEIALRLAHQTRSLEFHLLAISFVGEKELLFQTWLEGFEEGWSEPRRIEDRTIAFAGLKSGDYVLHVRAIDVEGRMSPEIVSSRIVLMRPLWQQAWFVVLMSLVGAGLVACVVSFRSQRRHSVVLEAEIKKATEELSLLEREQAGAQRLESLGLLAGGIAHDFNNLLTAILGNLSLLEDNTEDDVEAKSLVEGAQAACWRAQSLTNQLLTFSHGGAPVKRACAIDDVVRESASFALRGSNTHCDFEMDAGLWTVEVDAGQMSQVLHNLMINARQAMPDGGKVVVRAHNREAVAGSSPEGRTVVVEIEDEGLGISSEVAEHIFEPYFTTKELGTGLGLATASSIVRRHGGVLSHEAKVGMGSVFRIVLPASELEAQSLPGHESFEEGLSAKILVMDDEETVRAVVSRLLEDVGCTVIGVAEGSEAVAVYGAELDRGEGFDLVIMDLTVPGGMGGREATQRLLAIAPDARVIVTSGYSEDATMANFDQHGFVGRIPKPFRPSELFAEVSRILRPS